MSKIASFKNWFAKNEKFLSPIALFSGFIVDTLTLRRADLLIENLLFLFYLTLIAVSILIVNLYDVGKIRRPIFGTLRPWFQFFIQFAFGGIFSGFTVFYLRSSSFVTSWPFILMLVAVMVSTEFVKKIYSRLTIQVSVFYLAIVTFSIYVVPVLLKQIGPWIFLISMTMAILIVATYIKILKIGLKEKFEIYAFRLKRTIIITTSFIVLLYFTNIIPPIPLVAKSMGVYDYIVRQKTGEYVLNREPRPWKTYLMFRDEINIKNGLPAYFFSSVFAPSELNTKIFHHWQYYDPVKNRWISTGRIGFKIYGGSDTGYRGYTEKKIFDGLWRVDVETENGQIIGRETFRINLIK